MAHTFRMPNSFREIRRVCLHCHCPKLRRLCLQPLVFLLEHVRQTPHLVHLQHSCVSNIKSKRNLSPIGVTGAADPEFCGGVSCSLPACDATPKCCSKPSMCASTIFVAPLVGALTKCGMYKTSERQSSPLLLVPQVLVRCIFCPAVVPGYAHFSSMSPP